MKEIDDTLVERIKQIVSETLDVDPNTLRLTDAVYGQDEGLVSSLHWVEVNMGIKSEFHLEIPDEDMMRLETIWDYANYVHRQQAGLPPFENRPSPPQPSVTKRTARKKSTARQEQPQQQTDAALAWEFNQGRWEHTEDPIQQQELEPHQDIQHTLQQCGYKPSPILHMGKRGQGMHVEVYVKEQTKKKGAHNYYVRLWIGSEIESIYISNLPSLLTLLHRFGPIIANSQDT